MQLFGLINQLLANDGQVVRGCVVVHARVHERTSSAWSLNVCLAGVPAVTIYILYITLTPPPHPPPGQAARVVDSAIERGSAHPQRRHRAMGAQLRHSAHGTCKDTRARAEREGGGLN